MPHFATIKLTQRGIAAVVADFYPIGLGGLHDGDRAGCELYRRRGIQPVRFDGRQRGHSPRDRDNQGRDAAMSAVANAHAMSHAVDNPVMKGACIVAGCAIPGLVASATFTLGKAVRAA
jgi:hypothetical protein